MATIRRTGSETDLLAARLDQQQGYVGSRTFTVETHEATVPAQHGDLSDTVIHVPKEKIHVTTEKKGGRLETLKKGAKVALAAIAVLVFSIPKALNFATTTVTNSPKWRVFKPATLTDGATTTQKVQEGMKKIANFAIKWLLAGILTIPCKVLELISSPCARGFEMGRDHLQG